MTLRTRLTISYIFLVLLLIVVKVICSSIFAMPLLVELLLTLVLLVVGAIWTYRLTGRFNQQLESLTHAVQLVGDGDSEAIARLSLQSGELARLQDALLQMSTKLQDSMQRLASSEERFHAMFDAMAEGSALHRIQYSPDGAPMDYVIEEVNQGYELLLGLKRQQVVGKPATEAYQATPPPYLQEFATVVATGQASSFETYYAAFGRHFRISVCRVGPERFATLFEDVTGQKSQVETLHKTTQQLKLANEAKSRFLAVMSHEIRTPLNGITGMVQLLRDMELPSAQREYLNFIDSSADSLLNVINDILDFSKIEAEKLVLEQIPFQPSKLLHDTLRVMRLRTQAKGLLLSLVCTPGLAEVLVGDPHRLTQILNNLVANAIKFTAGGEIVVKASSRSLEDGVVQLTVEVKDPGIGMDQATQQAVFEPFTQADSSTTRKFGGTGLGLAICKQLVGLMRGTLTVTSSPGKGSTFSFTVPLESGVLPAVAPTPAAVTNLDHPLRILVAEDQPINQRFVAEILRKKGHMPLLANNGKEAVDIWNNEAVDMVLMDIQMPVLDGLKALAAIRAAEDGTRRHTPIVALTAHAILGDQERLLNAGFDGYLSKPLQVDKLFETMAKVLEQISEERRT